MSMIIIVPVLLPVAGPAALPIIAAAAAAAALGLGFTTAAQANEVEQTVGNEVSVDVPHTDEVAGQLSVGQSMVFEKDGVTVSFVRDAQGQMGVRVHGVGKSDEELAEIGKQMAQALVQQYAYHRIVTEMKERGMNIVDEEVEEDGTVRMQVRVYQ